jgi:hypothetical protein
MPDDERSSALGPLAVGIATTAVAAVAMWRAPTPWTLALDAGMSFLGQTVPAFRTWFAGTVPEWSDLLWGGFPLLAEPTTAALYPPHLLAHLATLDAPLRFFDVALALHVGLRPMDPEPELRAEAIDMATEVEIPALLGDRMLSAIVRFETGPICSVDVWLDGQHEAAQGADLFDALIAVRLGLERRNVLLLCSGARRDVYPSQLLRQSTQGRRAYVLRDAQDGPFDSVDIFTAASPELVTTVVRQRKAFEDWMGSPPESPSSP